jgi:hypothetical protein
MESEVAAITGRSDLSSNIQTRLQWAYDEISGLYDWGLLEGSDTTISLSDGTYQYAIPSSMRNVRTVRYVDTSNGSTSKMLEYKHVDDFDDEYPYPETEGSPESWTQRGSNIEVYLVPGSDEDGNSLYLTGAKWPTAFSGDSSTTDLSKDLDKAIIYLASSYTYDLIQEEQLAMFWQNKSNEQVDKSRAIEIRQE